MKNLLRAASDDLNAIGEKADEILEPAWELLHDLDFWIHQQDGLALLLSPGEFRYFHLPYSVPELALVSDTFYFKPLLPLFSGDEQFLILALTKNRAELYEANRYSIRSVPVEGLPEGIADSLRFDDADNQLQGWSSFGPTIGPKGSAFRGSVGVTFHGYGGEKEVRRDELLRYFRDVNRAIHARLADSHLPLLLAAVDYYFPIYQEANTYPFFLDDWLSVGVESLQEEELRERAWPIVKPYLNLGQKRMLERFERVAYSNGEGAKRAARELERVVIAASEGRVDSLVVPLELEVWGEFDQASRQVRRHPANSSRKRELTDLAIMETLLYGGEVFLVDEETMPPKAEVAAFLRYTSGLRRTA